MYRISRSCYYHLRLMRHIRRYLVIYSASTLVNSFVTSRVDYCNWLLAAAPKYQIDELQRVQNSAARLLLKLPTFERRLCSMVEERLHWLRIPSALHTTAYFRVRGHSWYCSTLSVRVVLANNSIQSNMLFQNVNRSYNL